MPTTPLRNLLYRAALPLAPSPRGQMSHQFSGHPVDMRAYESILRRHHVLGASLLLKDGDMLARVETSVADPDHHADADTIYRVASITKMATALVTLRLCSLGVLSLDQPVASLLPDAASIPALEGVTLRHLLSHTSGLCDLPAYEQALAAGQTFHDVLRDSNIRACKPGESMIYSNFCFGLVGSLLEAVTCQCLEDIFQQQLFMPLGMRATLNAASLHREHIMPISRVLPYRKGSDVRVTRLGRIPLQSCDPLHHFGHTAGAMYTDASSLSRLLTFIAQRGQWHGSQLISPELMDDMTRQHAFTGPAAAPTRRYGLGLVILRRDDIVPGTLLGHQGFAYGCVDGAFFHLETGRQMVFLNGGASEARLGRLGLVNKDLLHWAMQKEIPAWT